MLAAGVTITNIIIITMVFYLLSSESSTKDAQSWWHDQLID